MNGTERLGIAANDVTLREEESARFRWIAKEPHSFLPFQVEKYSCKNLKIDGKEIFGPFKDLPEMIQQKALEVMYYFSSFIPPLTKALITCGIYYFNLKHYF